jgi:hypothetical protein
LNLGVWDVIWDESQCDGETIATKLAQQDRILNTFKGANFDFRVPVFAPLLPDQEFRVASQDRSSLSGDTTFVLIARNSDLFGHFAETTRQIVNNVHRLHIFFIDDHRQELILCGQGLPFKQMKFLA